MFTDTKLLTSENITELNSEGKSLDIKKNYAIKFLFNDKWNEAADPRPFRIKTELIKKLADDAIGMPWIVAPYGEARHIRGQHDTAESLLEMQRKYTIGEIIDTIISKQNNVYGIIEIWPQFVGAVENDLIPVFVSPTILPISEDSDGISDAQFLNIQSVPTPGYPRALAGVTGLCKGGIKQCMEELRPIGAAGKLDVSFSNTDQLTSVQMSSTDNSNKGPTLEGVAADVSTLKETVTGLANVVTNLASEIKPILENMKATDKAPVGASGSKQELEQLKTELEQLKTDYTADKQRHTLEKRHAQAKIIVESLLKLKLKDVTLENKDKKIKEYVEMKDETGNTIDLSILVDTLSAQAKEIVGASGRIFERPTMTASKGSVSTSQDEVFAMMNGGVY